MPTHKSSDYKLSAVKYYLTHSKNQVQTCKIFGCSERSLMRRQSPCLKPSFSQGQSPHNIKSHLGNAGGSRGTAVPLFSSKTFR